MSATLVLSPNNTYTMKLSSLKNTNQVGFVNDAAVTMTLQERSGAEVAGQVWPLTLVYVTDSDGEYTGTISADVEITVDRKYKVKINVVDGSGAKMEKLEDVEVR